MKHFKLISDNGGGYHLFTFERVGSSTLADFYAFFYGRDDDLVGCLRAIIHDGADPVRDGWEGDCPSSEADYYYRDLTWEHNPGHVSEIASYEGECLEYAEFHDPDDLGEQGWGPYEILGRLANCYVEGDEETRTFRDGDERTMTESDRGRETDHIAVTATLADARYEAAMWLEEQQTPTIHTNSRYSDSVTCSTYTITKDFRVPGGDPEVLIGGRPAYDLDIYEGGRNSSPVLEEAWRSTRGGRYYLEDCLADLLPGPDNIDLTEEDECRLALPDLLAQLDPPIDASELAEGALDHLAYEVWVKVPDIRHDWMRNGGWDGTASPGWPEFLEARLLEEASLQPDVSDLIDAKRAAEAHTAHRGLRR